MATENDPVVLGLMQGSPPAPDRRVMMSDDSHWAYPQKRWSFSHFRELVPTANIWRGTAGPWNLPRELRDDIDTLSFTTMTGQKTNWRESLATTCTDGILVLHRGKILYERYFGALAPQLPHLAMSVTKSFIGVLAGMEVVAGRLDPAAPVTKYVPELGKSAYADATVRQVMDMIIGVQYSEDYTDPKAEIWTYARAANLRPRQEGEKVSTITEFLMSLKKQDEHGVVFAYKTCNTEVLGWILSRVTGRPVVELLSERIWQKIGAEEDAYVLVDGIGTPMVGGGLATTLRDLARFGEVIRRRGERDGVQIVPAAVIEDLMKGGDPDHFARSHYQTLPGWSYRNMWWISHDAHGAFTARGIHGQGLWIDPTAELVIARYATHEVAANGNSVLDHVSLPAWRALAIYLVNG